MNDRRLNARPFPGPRKAVGEPGLLGLTGKVKNKMIEWFDDLKLGMRFKGGEVAVTKEDIKRFAAEFDPQPMHLDEEAAKQTAFKGSRHRDGTRPRWR